MGWTSMSVMVILPKTESARFFAASTGFVEKTGNAPAAQAVAAAALRVRKPRRVMG